MAETKIIEDAKRLCFHTLKVTSNLNNFPKKWRFTLVDKIVRTSLDIYDNVSDAYNSWGSDRVKKQEEAIRSCRKMKFYLQLTYEVIKPKSSIPHWTEMVDNVERQALGWLKATKKKQ